MENWQAEQASVCTRGKVISGRVDKLLVHCTLPKFRRIKGVGPLDLVKGHLVTSARAGSVGLEVCRESAVDMGRTGRQLYGPGL